MQVSRRKEGRPDWYVLDKNRTLKELLIKRIRKSGFDLAKFFPERQRRVLLPFLLERSSSN